MQLACNATPSSSVDLKWQGPLSCLIILHLFKGFVSLEKKQKIQAHFHLYVNLLTFQISGVEDHEQQLAAQFCAYPKLVSEASNATITVDNVNKVIHGPTTYSKHHLDR